MEPYEKVIKGESNRVPRGYWKDEETCVKALRYYVDNVLKISPKQFKMSMLIGTPLSGMRITMYDRGNVESILEKFSPGTRPVRLDYSDVSIRKALVTSMLNDPNREERFSKKYIINLGHSDLLDYYGRDMTKLMQECAPDRMLEARLTFDDIPDALRNKLMSQYIAEKGRIPSTAEFFRDGVGYLIGPHGKNIAVAESFPENKEIWEVGKVPSRFWHNNDNIRYAAMWLEKKIGRKPMIADYRENNLSGLIATISERHIHEKIDLLNLGAVKKKRKVNAPLRDELTNFIKDYYSHTGKFPLRKEIPNHLLSVWNHHGKQICTKIHHPTTTRLSR